MFEKQKEYKAQSLYESRISAQILISSEDKNGKWDCKARIRIPDNLAPMSKQFAIFECLGDWWETGEGYITFCSDGSSVMPRFDMVANPNELTRTLCIEEGMAVKYVDNLDLVEKLYAKKSLPSRDQ